MNVKEFYESINGDYQYALSIMMNDFLIERMIAKFMSNNSYQEMIDAYDKKDYASLFPLAHSFKGVTGNLALTELYEISSVITEATRNGATPNLDNEIKALKDRYQILENSYQKYRQYLIFTKYIDKFFVIYYIFIC